MRTTLAYAVVLTVLANAMTGVAAGQGNFLSPEQAYRYEVRRLGSTIEIHWHIAPGYYLYKSRLGIDTSTSDITLGRPLYPKGQTHNDEFFGSQEIYRDSIVMSVPFRFHGAEPKAVTLQLKWQGCADGGLCYPSTIWTTEVLLDAME